MNINDPTRSLPQDQDAEKGVLSCFLHNPAILGEAVTNLPDDAFYHPANKTLYQVMKRMQADGRPVEYIAITNYTRDTGLLDKIGGAGTLSELLNFVPTPMHYPYYTGILRDKLKLRRVITACMDTVAQAYEHHEDVGSFMSLVAERYFELTRQNQTVGRKAFKEIVSDYMETWEKRMRGDIETGIPTRWPSFNATFGGITPHMWLICGYPSDGKSSLAQNLAEDTLAHGGEVLWFHYESNETEVVDRLMTARTQLSSQKIFFPQNGVKREEMHLITRACGDMAKWGLHLRCEATWTVEQIVAETRSMRLKHDIRLVVVDYLQLIPSGKDFGTNRAQEVAHMSATLKQGSASMTLPFVVMSQLNDDGKTRESRAPNQDAHNVVFIVAPQPEEKDARGRTLQPAKPGGLRVVKNRNGKRGDLLPISMPDKGTFTFFESRGSAPEPRQSSRTRYPEGDE
jgi:replicative DNA helicase